MLNHICSHGDNSIRSWCILLFLHFFFNLLTFSLKVLHLCSQEIFAFFFVKTLSGFGTKWSWLHGTQWEISLPFQFYKIICEELVLFFSLLSGIINQWRHLGMEFSLGRLLTKKSISYIDIRLRLSISSWVSIHTLCFKRNLSFSSNLLNVLE